jgi:hypothetical protein
VDNGKMLEVILEEVRFCRGSITTLDDKLDRKIDIVHSRITQESGERATLATQVSCQAGKIRGLVSRINWVYVILGGFFLAVVGAALALVFKG